MAMDDSKKAAKAFVDKYFPQKQPTTEHNILDGLFPPLESSKKKEFEGQNSNAQSTTADGSNSQGSPSKNKSTPQNDSNAIVLCEVPESCLMSSSVDYGCRDNYYPYPPGSQHPGNFNRDKKDRKEGYDYTDLENSRGEWWQGSFYY